MKLNILFALSTLSVIVLAAPLATDLQGSSLKHVERRQWSDTSEEMVATADTSWQTLVQPGDTTDTPDQLISLNNMGNGGGEVDFTAWHSSVKHLQNSPGTATAQQQFTRFSNVIANNNNGAGGGGGNGRTGSTPGGTGGFEFPDGPNAQSGAQFRALLPEDLGFGEAAQNTFFWILEHFPTPPPADVFAKFLLAEAELGRIELGTFGVVWNMLRAWWGINNLE